MIRYALVSGQLMEPYSGLEGTCPGCDSPLIPKCGPIKMHHWAHQRNKNCDPWWESMSQWHIDWQNQFPIEWREVILRDENSGEFHRADIHTPEGLTIEFQHSSLSLQELLSRNNFYKKLIWVVNAQNFKDNITLTAAIPNPRSPMMARFNFLVSSEGLASYPRYVLKDDMQHGPLIYGKGLSYEQLEAITNCQESSPEIYWLFYWSYKHRSWLDSRAPVFLDFGEDTLYWIRRREQVGVPLLYLQVVKKADFIAKYARQA